jgi:hypothetical protein
MSPTTVDYSSACIHDKEVLIRVCCISSFAFAACIESNLHAHEKIMMEYCHK